MLVALATATATLASGCALSAGPSSAPDPAGSTFGHMHGLGVDDGASTVYVATHGGLYSIPEEVSGAAPTISDLTSPIADRAQDTMGFTFLDGTMYGSGHPDPQNPEGNPPNLGLITSTDNAQTWKSVSLRGDVDFHDIAAARGSDGAVLLHGYSAMTGTIMTSYDSGLTWTQGATIGARDLAVDADDGSALYATTQNGVAVSTDGGATFEAVPDAPPLYLIDSLHDRAGGLVGVDTDGTIWVRSLGDWQSTGTIAGSAEALTFNPQANLLVVADENGVSTSTDHGLSWQAILVR